MPASRSFLRVWRAKTLRPGQGDYGIAGLSGSRLYERYSAIGANRLSLTFSMLAVGDEVAVTAVASGGGTGVFFKLNTFGEEAFRSKAGEAIRSFVVV